MATISLCMIVKNEEAVLARCLDSVLPAVDELIIVDTGSTDGTRELARRYTHRVLDFAWVQDFSKARNFAFDQATQDYQMWLDADDYLPPDQLKKLLALKAALPADTDMVTMKYHTHLDAQGRPLLTSTRERLIRRAAGLRWQDPVHECIPLGGKMLHSDIEIVHLKPPAEGVSTRNLEIYEALEGSGSPLTPRQQYYFARELRDHGLHGQAVEYFRRFLDGGRGWHEDNVAACLALSGCLMALGRPEESRDALLESFRHGAPRAEICCALGYYYKDRGLYGPALGWFQTAAALPRPDTLGFVPGGYGDYIPCIEACVCCCKLGRYAEARQYNDRAGEHRPGDPAVLHNARYLAGILG